MATLVQVTGLLLEVTLVVVLGNNQHNRLVALVLLRVVVVVAQMIVVAVGYKERRQESELEVSLRVVVVGVGIINLGVSVVQRVVSFSKSMAHMEHKATKQQARSRLLEDFVQLVVARNREHIATFVELCNLLELFAILPILRPTTLLTSLYPTLPNIALMPKVPHVLLPTPKLATLTNL